MECQYKLILYGIPQCILPVDINGTLKEAEFMKSCEERWAVERERERVNVLHPKKETTTGEPNIVLNSSIRTNDVLLGRGVSQSLPGNINLSNILQMRSSVYEKASKFEKTCIAMSIVGMVKESNGRFLKPCGKGSREWVEASDLEARKSVISRFRNIVPLDSSS